MYGAADLDLQLMLLGDSRTMSHLGGPESYEQIAARHERYLRMTDSDAGLVYVIEADDGAAAGTISYWSHRWRSASIWETGWLVLPEYRGRGLATRAVEDLIDLLAVRPAPRSLHAFPSVSNVASNALCAKTGFELLEEVDFEYPEGHRMRCNDWSFTFGELARGPAR